ncbi:MAG: MATE family efflux transporter [Clostridia bacterium]|nr:MATE family efflux transporter [Clostridia bacterium]
MANRHSMDLTTGSVFKKLLLFTLPILASNMIQQLYHAADVMVVGQFAFDPVTSLAAVGSSGSITTLILNVFLGLSVGANVACANLYGRGDHENLNKTMYTSLILAVVGGIFVGIVGFAFARPLLLMTGCPPTIIEEATTYMQIIFLGQPFNLIFNFGAGILRSHGDSKRPMYILTAAGLVNVVLNVFFVVAFHWDAAGVAAATSISNLISAAAVLAILFHPNGEFHLSFREVCFSFKAMKEIARIGLPSGINGILFSVSNVMLTSSVNTFDDVIIAGNSAANSVDNILFQFINSIYTAVISFTGQNYGKRDFSRIHRGLFHAILLNVGIYAFLDIFILVKPEFFVGIFTDEAAVIAAGAQKVVITGAGYVLYVVSDLSIGALRGMGVALIPTVINVACICLTRLVWILFIFPFKHDFKFLLLCYPISWIISSTAQLICYFYYRKKKIKEWEEEQRKALGLNHT